MVIDLDEHVKSNRDFRSLHPILASENNIDHYSYEYEMMLLADLLFFDAEGLALTFLEHEQFDLVGFEQALVAKNRSKVLAEIAKEHLSITDLTSEPRLEAALIEAFKLGQCSVK